LLTLLVFALAGLPGAAAGLHVNLLAPLRQGTDLQSLLYASALMFVAYTGYGRVATLGEEVRDPLRTIPRAIVLTLLATMGIYLLVTTVAVGAVGAGALAEATGRGAAPLAVAAGGIGGPGLAALVSAGAVTAMLGVLLNLVLG